MILYYSGTGNTRYVAQSLGAILHEDCRFIPKTDLQSFQPEGKYLIFAFPVYSWGVPPLVLEFISKTPQAVVERISSCGIQVSMVCTCGDEVAMTPEIFISAWRKRGVEVKGAWSVIMPNDYVLLPGFDVDKKELEESKLNSAPTRIREIAEIIIAGKEEIDVVRGSWPRFKSRVIYPLFKRWGVNPKKWTSSDKCIHCGKCAAVCPVKNVTMESGKPKWGNKCASCTACYQYCPVRAISYGHYTDNKGQYHCPLAQ